MADSPVTPQHVRTALVERLEQDLIGPHSHDESLLGRPSDIYVTGMLWPIDERMGAEDDDGGGGDDENEEQLSTATIVGQQRPCTMGISFATQSHYAHAIEISVGFSTYDPVETQDANDPRIVQWVRRPHEFAISLDLAAGDSSSHPLRHVDLIPDVELHVRSIRSGSGLLTTVTLINRTTPTERDRDSVESATIFQTSLVVRPAASTRIVARPPGPASNDEDERSARLLYRDCLDFAAGHQCSVSWDAQGSEARQVGSAWLPHSFVLAFKEDGAEEFSSLVKSGRLAADWLARAADTEVLGTLWDLADAYGAWIEGRRGEIAGLPHDLQETAKVHISVCQGVLGRIRAGVEALNSRPLLMLSFRYSNAAMALQHSWKRDLEDRPLKSLTWRPFQLGFILLAAESTCDGGSEDRETLDLLWFPTGGGKTEAYLALIALLAWHRRLGESDPDDGSGNAAVMRYTLRLLTAQQFERAAALILACELIRRGLCSPREGSGPLGSVPFSIGLWVGRDATPNNYAGAIAARKDRSSGSSPEQINTCYACRGHLRWVYDDLAGSVSPRCDGVECKLGDRLGPWPVHTVDSDLYRAQPTLVIGTVDKFAQMPFKTEIAHLFGFGTDQATDLIIQDELHLISGPLGTIVGIYETAFDWLLIKDGRRPKVLGSTATIRRAPDQVRALFDRNSCQFPPPGLAYNDSGFAVVDHSRPSREYVGVTTAGRSAKFTFQAVAGSLLQSAGPSSRFPDDARDGYGTLLCYFNSLRELGGAIVQILDDVPDSMGLYAQLRGEDSRHLAHPQELTSRVAQKEIVSILADLARSCAQPDAVDVVLATNMVSVGVDVPRLGLMLVNGQPKTRAEYIQSTSRVGRATFPGLVVDVMNAAKARDRSHFETFPAWHQALYRDVEATSVTPFASRSRDKALRAVLVTMIRHGHPALGARPNLNDAPGEFLSTVVDELERRIGRVDPSEESAAAEEIDAALEDWDARNPRQYLAGRATQAPRSLMQRAEDYARRAAAGRIPDRAWPTMNTMRSVEASTPFRMAEALTDPRAGRPASGGPGKAAPRWRRGNGK